MSGIVLRCPNCGTAQPEGGECEACRDAQVRYFCTNHSPGLWLESVSCAQCGASFGDPAPARDASPASRIRTEYRPSRPSEPGLDLRRTDPDPRPRAAEPFGEPGFGTHGGGRPDASGLLVAILNAAVRSRRRGTAPFGDAGPEVGRRGPGCLGRLLVLVLFMIALFLMVPIFLGALLGYG